MSGGAYALFARVSLHGSEAEELRVEAGRGLTIGRRGDLVVPLPAGLDVLAEVVWVRRDLVRVTDGRGESHLVGPDDTYTAALGALTVQLELVRQFALRRTEPFPLQGSLAFFAVLVAFSLMVSQVELLLRYRCDWLPLFGASCPVENQAAVDTWNAEYLARLLREDLEGEDDGVVEVRPPRQVHEIEAPYVPVGDMGDPEQMMGAVETAPAPVRSTEEAEAVRPAPAVDETPELEAVADVGEQLPAPTKEEEPVESPEDGKEGYDTDAEAKEVEPGEAPKEVEQGWGFRDWIEAETTEVEEQLRIARRRLRIDPDDLDALSILAYYQYLGQDYRAAEATWDRVIEKEPEAAFAYNNKALVYKRLGDWQTEEALYRVALALDPEDATAMNNLAVNLAHQKRYDEALAYMRRLEVLLPGDPYCDLHRAKIRADMGDDEEALRLLDRALAGMKALDVLHHIEFRQDIRVDPSFAKLRDDPRFHAILRKYYGADAPVRE